MPRLPLATLAAALLALSLLIFPELAYRGLFVDPPRQVLDSARPAVRPPPLEETRLSILPPPERLAQAFRNLPVSAPAPKRAEEPAQITENAEPAKADWLVPIGKIEDAEGIVRQFFKDRRRGSMLGVRMDGEVENAAKLVEINGENWILEIDGVRYLASGGDR